MPRPRRAGAAPAGTQRPAWLPRHREEVPRTEKSTGGRGEGQGEACHFRLRLDAHALPAPPSILACAIRAHQLSEIAFLAFMALWSTQIASGMPAGRPCSRASPPPPPAQSLPAPASLRRWRAVHPRAPSSLPASCRPPTTWHCFEVPYVYASATVPRIRPHGCPTSGRWRTDAGMLGTPGPAAPGAVLGSHQA